jgi:hypothetical protein
MDTDGQLYLDNPLFLTLPFSAHFPDHETEAPKGKGSTHCHQLVSSRAGTRESLGTVSLSCHGHQVTLTQAQNPQDRGG